MLANGRLQWLVACVFFVAVLLALVVGALLQQPLGAGRP
jgi:hypothetical protein